MAEGKKKSFPVGIESFEESRKDGFYYVDKTGLIIDLLQNWGKVTLFTRPRRFGKTLNMSMLESFFSPDSDKSVFQGLKISGETGLCEEYMGKYPVVSVSLKEINAGDFETASAMAARLVRTAAKRYENVLAGSSTLSASDKQDFEELLDIHMPRQCIYCGLKTLCVLLEKHFGQKVVVLIDEYDVPLAKAYELGYYDQMVLLIRNMFEQVLKTNNSLKFAVLTGCMRISKESIFTGLNNLEVYSVSDEEYAEYFGFTDAEVRSMMAYYGLSGQYETVKDWYDGYRFGRTSIYCPWDVVCYCKKLYRTGSAGPENFWLNSSGNTIVRKLIEYGGTAAVKGEMEGLLNGESIEKTIEQDLTYPDMYASVENIWSVLYTTGYLTKTGYCNGSRMRLAIPNREISNIFSQQILALFREDVKKDGTAVDTLCDALRKGNVRVAEESLNHYLRQTISVRDTAVRKSLKENFYHGILLGILSAKDSWSVLSNQESGNGYSDIQIRDTVHNLAIIIEVKYAEDGKLDATCAQGLQQMEEKHYADKLQEEKFDAILKYGMAFYLKECRIMLAEH